MPKALYLTLVILGLSMAVGLAFAAGKDNNLLQLVPAVLLAVMVICNFIVLLWSKR